MECPYCGNLLEDDEFVHRCPECLTALTDGIHRQSDYFPSVDPFSKYDEVSTVTPHTMPGNDSP
jgi:hypothetical protein